MRIVWGNTTLQSYNATTADEEGIISKSVDILSLRLPVDEETELRILTERDASDLYALVDQNRAYLCRWLPWVDATRSIEDELDFIRITQGHVARNDGFTCAIWHRGMIAGTIGYHPIDWISRKVEIGYMLAPQFQGKGLMTKACRVMVNYAFTVLKLTKVEVRCATDNERSCAIPERLGFTRRRTVHNGQWLNDRLIDLYVYGVYASEWEVSG